MPVPSSSGSDVLYWTAIAALSLAVVVLWLEFRRLKAKAEGRGRRISEVLSDPREVQNHVLEAMDGMREMVAPTRQRRFRKRDKLYFQSQRLARRLGQNAPDLRRRATETLMG